MELLLKDALLMNHDMKWLEQTASMTGIEYDPDPVITAERLAEKMLDPEFYSSATEFAALERKKAALTETLEQDMNEWAVLSEELGE